MSNKVLNIDEAIELHRCNAKVFELTQSEILERNERNLVEWLTDYKTLKEEMSEVGNMAKFYYENGYNDAINHTSNSTQEDVIDRLKHVSLFLNKEMNCDGYGRRISPELKLEYVQYCIDVILKEYEQNKKDNHQ